MPPPSAEDENTADLNLASFIQERFEDNELVVGYY
jgi:hypothetical protein